MLKKLHINPRFDILSNTWSNDGVVWSNEPGFFFKGDSTAKAAEQQQAAFNSQLMTIFNQQFAKQSQLLTYLQGKLQPMINNPTGYAPDALAAMRTSATDTLSQQYQNAQAALNNQQLQKNGGSDLPSGAQEQLDAALLQSEATDKANAQNTITMNDANLKQSNYWNALNVLNGQTAQQYNPLGYASAATSGSEAVANLSQAYTTSQGPGIMGMIGSLAGAGAQLGSAAITKCHVAAAVFNEPFETGIKTALVRNWLYNEFSKHIYAKPILAFYTRYSKWMSTKPLLVRILTPLFNRALDKALEQETI